jgi:hypothetical protein
MQEGEMSENELTEEEQVELPTVHPGEVLVWTKEKTKSNIEFEANVVEIGLSGAVIRPIDEHKLWAAHKMFPVGTKVKIIMEKA